MTDKHKVTLENSEYNVYIIGKHVQVTEPMRAHILAKLEKLEKFHSHLMDIHVSLEISKVDHVCVIVCHFNHLKVKVEATSNDMYASIDKAVHKLQQLFRKWKGKIQDYHKKPLSMIDMAVNVYHRPPMDEVEQINEEIDAENLKSWIPGKIISHESCVLKTLTTEEAMMKMELSSDPFMLYVDQVDKKLKVIYRREDQNYGVIHAEKS